MYVHMMLVDNMIYALQNKDIVENNNAVSNIQLIISVAHEMSISLSRILVVKTAHPLLRTLLPMDGEEEMKGSLAATGNGNH